MARVVLGSGIMVPALTLLLGCQLIGELIARALGLPVPGPVLGMALLFGLLLWRGQVWPPLAQAADFLLRHLSLLFVPAGVGVLQHWPLIEVNLLPLAITLVLSTLLAMLAGAGAFLLVQRWRGEKP
jgi:holin-like protein